MLKIRLFYAIVFIGLSIFISSPIYATSPIQTEHFRIMGFGGEIHEMALKRIAKDLEAAYIDIATFLDMDPYRFSKIEVNVLLKPQGGSGIRAGADAARINLDAGFSNMKLLKHELTHILISKPMSSAPRWFHEGLAQYMSEGDIREANKYPRLDLNDFSFMRLEAMFGATKTENEAYYYAWSIVSYIIDEYGKEKLQKLFKESGFLKDRFVRVYGVELSSLEEKANEIFAKYKPKDR